MFDPLSGEEDSTLCSECGGRLVEPEDIEDGMHFLCDPTVEWDDEDPEETQDEVEHWPASEWDEGGESG